MLTNLRQTLGLVASLVAIGACSDDSHRIGTGEDNVGQQDGGGSSGGASSGGVGGTAGSGGSTGGSSGGSGTGGSAGFGAAGSACSQFEDSAGWSVAVQITNRRSETIYVGQRNVTCDVAPLFHVRDATSVLPELGMCRNACEDLMQGETLGCPTVCLFPQAIKLEPGEATTTIWSGLFAVEETLPRECLPAGQQAASTSCNRAEQIEPGTFTFVAGAGTTIDCSQTTLTCGECTANGSGGCTTPGALIAGSVLTAETTVELDASYGVGDVSGGGATLPVEIIFNQ